MEPRFVYITCKNLEEATLIGKRLVRERLAACANLLPGMTSFYWWEGKVQEDTEVVLILKSRADLAEAVIERVNALHSYDVPCIVFLPIEAGNPAYLRWIQDETQPKQAP